MIVAASRTAASLLVWAGVCASAQAPPPSLDSALAAYIARIRAVDNHAHPMRPIPPGASADTEYDALPLDAIPAFPMPLRLRPENPEWRAAQRALFGVAATDTGAFRAELKTARARSCSQIASRLVLGSRRRDSAGSRSTTP
jgi:hypothetical protein